MISTNKKLTKEIKAIITATENAKALAQTELDKIDAKYKALADKEKAELTKTVKFLNSQLATYVTLLGEEKESAITDTVFPENNETESVEDADSETSVVNTDNATHTKSSNTEAKTEEITVDEKAVETIAEAFSEESTESTESNVSSDAVTETTESNTDDLGDIWPEEIEEWK